MSATRSNQGVFINNEDGDSVKVTLDGSDLKIEVIGKSRNVSGTIVNPATEDTLSTRASETTLSSRASESTLSGFRTDFNNEDFATQTTLAAILVDTGQVETLLTTIDADTSNLDVALSTRATEATLATRATSANQTNKNQYTRLTDGTNDAVVDASGDLQVIHTDALPAGSNIIGKVVVRSNSKGTSVGADLTSNNVDANTEALHVSPATLAPNAATETTLSAFRTDFNNEDFASETTLATRATSANQTNKNQYTRLTDGTNDAVVNASGDLQIIHVDPLPVGDNWVGRVKVGDGTDFAAIVDDGGIKRLRVDAKLGTGDENAGRIKITDGTDVLDILTESVATAGLNGLMPLAKTAQALSTFLLAQPDGALVTANKPPSAPPGTTDYQAVVDEAELEVGTGGDVASPHTTLGPIVPNGETLTLQSVEVGTEGDSSENGSVVEVYWREGVGPTDHLVGRYYVMGETVQVVLPDVESARDGTVFTGDGSTTRIIVVRRRLSVAALEIDFVIRGYTS